MNRKVLISATAMAAVAGLSIISSGASFAGVSDVQTQLNAACYALRNPNDNANFTALAVLIVAGDPVEGGGTLVGEPVVVVTPGSGSSTPTWSPLFRNGQSPNLFSTRSVSFVTEQTTTTSTYYGPVNFTFGCQYFNQNGIHTSGQDTFNNPGTALTTYETVVTTGGEAVTLNEQMVVCISPSTTVKKGNPGAWRIQNGWTGTIAECAATAASLPAIPSNSLPL